MIRRPPRSTLSSSSAASDVYKRQMSDMASRFADKDGEDAEDENESTSSFEEVQRPVERPSAALAARQEVKTGVSDERTAEAARSNNASSTAGISNGPAATSKPANESRQLDDGSNKASSETATQTPAAAAPSASAAAGGLRDVLQEIRGMLQSQNSKIEELTSEVAQLKAKMGA